MARKKEANTGRVLTKKGAATRAAILDAAQAVFRDTGYYASSVSEITRRAGVSLATFYQYFKNKEQVFWKLNDFVMERFMNKAESLSLAGLDFDSRLKKIITLLYDHIKNNLAFHRILGESELVDRITLAYYEAIARFLRNFLGKEVAAGNIRPLDPHIIAYGLIGICYFNSFKWGDLDDNLSAEQTVDLMVELIMNGISGPLEWKRQAPEDILNLPEPLTLSKESEEPLTKGEKTRQAILQAAEKVFGQHGINRASIAEITREAGVAAGTFYVYFASKAQLVEGYVKYINRNLRWAIQQVAALMPDRRDAERAGIIVCFNFVRRHRKVYRIIPEFEMIDKEVALWYYKKIAQGYIQGLKQAMNKGEIRPFPPAFLAYSLMGITHFIGLKWIIWTAAISPAHIRQTLENNIEFVLWGLAPKK